MTENPQAYPVRVDAALETKLSRGLWLVKWLLLVPHWLVLIGLWIAFVVLTVIAFFAILFTGRYPRALFDFNVGVLRWSWRVHYYGYAALGTDRYPPFTLAEVPDYPAHLRVDYPPRLSRGLVLVKWWLLAIPHYLVVGIFAGGGLWLSTRGGNRYDDSWAFGGLIGLLVLIAAIVLLFRGRYPRSLFDFVLGMDRWVLRVAAYVSLMTDRYPPFRLDSGGADPGWLPATPLPPVPPGGVPAAAGPAGQPAAAAAGGPAGPQPAARSGWTGGRIVSVVMGAILLFFSTGLLAGGAGLLWADRTQRDGGYLWTPTATMSTSSYALTAEGIQLEGSAADWTLSRTIGTVKVQVTPRTAGTALFVGLAATSDADRYLQGVRHAHMGVLAGRSGTDSGRLTGPVGGAPAQPPADAGFWAAQASGTDTQTLTWKPTRGDWTLVIMRADGGAGVSARVQAGAAVPGAPWIAGGMLGVGVLVAAAGGLLIGLAARRASQRPPTAATPAPPLPAPRQGGGPGADRPVSASTGPRE